MKRKLRFLNMEPEQVARRARREKNRRSGRMRKQREHNRKILVAVLPSQDHILQGSARVVGSGSPYARANRPQVYTSPL